MDLRRRAGNGVVGGVLVDEAFDIGAVPLQRVVARCRNTRRAGERQLLVLVV
jgi:hypothetical protein